MTNFVDNLDGTVTVSRLCGCGEKTIAIVTNVELVAYKNGAFVQQAFPSLTAEQRESLFMSGMCATCWDNLFADEDEEDYPEDNYYSGTGELVGDDSYIDYLNK